MIDVCQSRPKDTSAAQSATTINDPRRFLAYIVRVPGSLIKSDFFTPDTLTEPGVWPPEELFLPNLACFSLSRFPGK